MNKTISFLRLLLFFNLLSCVSLHLSSIRQGIRYYSAGKYEESIIILETAQKTAPNNPKIHFYLAGAYAEVKEYKKSYSHYQELIKDNPGFLKKYSQLFLVKRITSVINSPDYLIEIAKIYYGEKKIQEANILCQKVLEKNPNCINALIFTGNIYSDEGKNKEALTMFEKAILQNPEVSKKIGEQYFICLEKVSSKDKSFKFSLTILNTIAKLEPNLGKKIKAFTSRFVSEQIIDAKKRIKKHEFDYSGAILRNIVDNPNAVKIKYVEEAKNQLETSDYLAKGFRQVSPKREKIKEGYQYKYKLDDSKSFFIIPERKIESAMVTGWSSKMVNIKLNYNSFANYWSTGRTYSGNYYYDNYEGKQEIEKDVSSFIKQGINTFSVSDGPKATSYIAGYSADNLTLELKVVLGDESK